MKPKFLILITALTFIFMSCFQGYIKFEARDPEVIPTTRLKEFMRNHESPKIVLRVPNPELITTETGDNDLLFNSIEKEFTKAGYRVRDRALFEEILSKSDDDISYEEISKRTDTDLILELVKLDTDVLYETNKYYTYSGNQRLFPNNIVLDARGAEVRFKLILISENELAGNFTFHYVPCPNGCDVEVSPSEAFYKVDQIRSETYPYQSFEIDQLEVFIKRATRNLIEILNELKNWPIRCLFIYIIK